MVVEDHKISQKVALLVLNYLYCQVSNASTGAEAVAMFVRNQYDMIFMDLGLPDIDGFAVTETIRKLEEGKPNRIPIIALSAHTNQLFEKKTLEAGMDFFMEKPLTTEKAFILLKKFAPEHCYSIEGRMNQREFDLYELAVVNS